MQRVTNCILIDNNHILLLQKPRRGWFAIPGGKMGPGETIKESVIREYREETALHLDDPQLLGVFTFNIATTEQTVDEWMMFTFVCRAYHGKLTDHCAEGELEWVPFDRVQSLPMAQGDRPILEHAVSSQEVLYGSFAYTEENALIDMRLDPPPVT